MSHNFKKTTISSKTVRNYEQRLRTLKNHYKRAYPDQVITWSALVDWFVLIDGRWSASSVRGFKAALVWAGHKYLKHDEAQRFEYDLTGIGPIPHSLQSSKNNGAPIKRKSFTAKEWDTFSISAFSRPNKDDIYAFKFLECGLLFPHRPIELSACKLEGDQLTIANAKSNEVRGTSAQIPDSLRQKISKNKLSDLVGDKFRIIDLSALSPKHLTTLMTVLSELPERVKASGGWAKFYGNLRKRCERISQRAGIYPAIVPSTIRHMTLSAIKSVQGHQAAAALAGQVSERSPNHYKRASSEAVKLVPATSLKVSIAALELVKRDEASVHPKARAPKVAKVEPKLDTEKQTGASTSEPNCSNVLPAGNGPISLGSSVAAQDPDRQNGSEIENQEPEEATDACPKFLAG